MDKRLLIKELVSHKDTICFRTVYRLLSAMLDEARVMNDTAPLTEVPKIQGRIEVIKGLMKDMTPSPTKRVHYDGGFGG